MYVCLHDLSDAFICDAGVFKPILRQAVQIAWDALDLLFTEDDNDPDPPLCHWISPLPTSLSYSTGMLHIALERQGLC